MEWKFEPARITAAIQAALFLAAAFGLMLNELQIAAIVGFTGAILSLVSGEVIRANVFAPASVTEIIDETKRKTRLKTLEQVDAQLGEQTPIPGAGERF